MTLGLKNEDMVFMPVLSTLARLFWAAVIFLGGWKENQQCSSATLPRGSTDFVTGCWVQFELRESRLFFFNSRRRNTLSQAEPKEEDQQRSQSLKHRAANHDWEDRFNLKFTNFSVYTHFPRKVCTVEFGVILSRLYRSVWKFPFLPKEGRGDAFWGQEAFELQKQGPPAGRTLHWLGGRRMTIWYKVKKKKSAKATTLLKVRRSTESGASFRGCIKECLFLPLPCWGAPSLWGWWFLATWRRGAHILQERHTFNSGKCWCAAVGCVNLLQVFEESFAQVLTDVLRYQTVGKAQKVLCVGKNTAEGKQRVCVRSRSIIVQYCCHLLASCGSANAKRNKSVEFRPVNKSKISLSLSLLLIIYPHCGRILSSLWCMLWIWPLLPLRCFSSSVQ